MGHRRIFFNADFLGFASRPHIGASPAKVTKVIPAILEENQQDVQLKIFGERINGSAFYDPGEGFARRLHVDIEGMEIKSIKWVSPTQIDLVVATSHATETPFKTIKITNPDGHTRKAGKMVQIVKKP